MALFGIFSFRSFSFGLKISKLSALHLSTVSSADLFYDHLQKNNGNVEKILATVKTTLDSRCVNQVLHKCSFELSLMGLRFFIWAGRQPNYRHSSFMYSRACELIGIDRSPCLLLNVIEDYRREGCVVDIRMFKVMLNLCKEAKLANEALLILGKMPEFHLRADTTIYNLVVRLFIEKGEMDKAMKLMEEMDSIDIHPNMITYIAMLKGFCDVGRLEDAYGLFKAMKENGCSPNTLAYSILLNGASRQGITEKIMELLEEMEKEGGNCSPNTVTYTSIIQSLCELGQPLEALKILDRMENSGCAPNRVTVRTLIKEFCKDGHMEEVYELIHRVVARGGTSYGDCYSSLVVSLAKMKKIAAAEELFRNMLASGVKPDGVACSVMIKELCLEERVLDGYNLCNEVDRNGYLSSIDSDIYSLLLVGLCEHDHPMDAEKLARLMLKKGIRLKPHYADHVIKHLNKFGDQELVMQLGGIRK
ncbi:pentatricopeptide repeat-containing protein At5g47360 [Momordica charantia]|uniref:Pentatricopeptide repeat-containing protein At5g47360 n=1 Tax=Momordica charantia TaxID=3673 RepID=A0A6J1DNK5_MOMCH|nr:pentatricopeptide repeat-containing protein At5g47360 [Momordica charantia]XP_022155854.1 pentatricopeptide repeat-containing protein At5g47360 [Momordica charantia]XP_022155855.1 pentatricopeptide repeat-containing protein At5g47360 [Momordica charantia]XP_022155856.1 pentatricopeptide repeat-containing protein At5g47360 [Momordica charantia]